MWNLFARKTVARKSSPPESSHSSQIKELVTTRQFFAQTILQSMVKQEPPFDHNEWHLATVRIPEQWMDAFELLCGANALLTIVATLGASKHGQDEAARIYEILLRELKVHAESEWLGSVLAEMVTAKAFPSDHPVFQLPEALKFSMHGWAFARAEIGLKRFQMVKEERMVFIGKLGACFVYNQVCASERFHPVIEKLRFVDSDEEMEAAHAAENPKSVTKT
jgi:hypothetical protein